MCIRDRQSAVQRYLNGKASFFDRWQIDTRKLSQHTLDQILNLALKDNVLIRGWGAAALFQGIRGVICVRVCAPMALRVRVMMERLGVKDAETIQQEIEGFDAGHSRAMRAAFNFDWNDALPVSYTHLDVYKRQLQGLPRPQRRRRLRARPRRPWTEHRADRARRSSALGLSLIHIWSRASPISGFSGCSDSRT